MQSKQGRSRRKELVARMQFWRRKEDARDSAAKTRTERTKEHFHLEEFSWE